MAYRHYGGFGQTVDPKYDGTATEEPKKDEVVPSPTEITPLPNILPAATPTTQAPAAPVVPLPAMTASSAQSSGLISGDGLFGVPWRWWIIGGIALLVLRSRGGQPAKVASNARRRRRGR